MTTKYRNITWKEDGPTEYLACVGDRITWNSFIEGSRDGKVTSITAKSITVNFPKTKYLDQETLKLPRKYTSFGYCDGFNQFFLSVAV